VGGTYAAWRLVSATDSNVDASRVRVFERTDRIGGRYFSPALSGCESGCGEEHVPRAELGGMRLRGGKDHILLGAARKLHIPLGPFRMNDGSDPIPATQDDPKNPIWCRKLTSSRETLSALLEEGKTLRYGTTSNGQLGFEGAIPYVLDDYTEDVIRLAHSCNHGHSFGTEVLNCPNSSAVEGALDAPQALDACDSAAFIATQEAPSELYGEPQIWQTSRFDDLLRRNSNSSFGARSDWVDLRSCISGYSAVLMGRNAGTSLYPWGDSETTEYLRPLRGMQDLPETFARHFEAYGGSIHRNSELTQVDQDPSTGEWKLTFARTATSPCTSITRATEETFSVRAKKVVLNLPLAPLSRVKFGGAAQQKVTKLLGAISGANYAKYFLVFREPWFHSRASKATGYNFTVGRFTSSTAITQAFAWYPGTQAHEDTVPETCQDVHVLQLYDTSATGGWESNPDAQAAMDCDSGDGQCSQCFDPAQYVGPISNQATIRDWARIKNILLEIFGPGDIPEPLEIRHHIWRPTDPVAQMHAVHTWNAGYRWWEKYADALQPMPGLHIVGEAFSLNSGWGEGAAETAEYMLQEKLGMQRPPWLSRQHYCQAMPYYPERRAV